MVMAVTLALQAACAGAPAKRAKGSASPYDLALFDTDGQVYSLSALKGQVALIHFFATWCFPCMVEVPQLQELQRQLGPEGFQAVGIGMDLEGARVLAPFGQTYGIQYPVLIADDQVREGFSPFGTIEKLPSTFILDRKGRVAAAYSGPANPTALRELIGRLVKQPQ
jgi:peroxiredoxin